MRRRWTALTVYVALVYAAIPFTADLGNAFLRTAAGQWVFGPGLALVVVGGAVVILDWLRRRRAPLWAYVTIGVAGVGYLLTLSSLAVRPLERVHLPEYGVLAVLAWLAVRSLGTPLGRGHVAAFVITAAVGYGEEVIQYYVPGRFFDWSDVRLKAASGALALVVLAAMRAGGRRQA